MTSSSTYYRDARKAVEVGRWNAADRWTERARKAAKRERIAKAHKEDAR